MAEDVDKIKKAIEKQTGTKVKMVRLGFNPKRAVIWLVVLFIVLPFIVSLFAGPLPTGNVGLSQLLTDIKAGKVDSIEVQTEQLLVKYKNQTGVVESRKDANEGFVDILNKSGIDPTTVNFTNKDTSAAQAWSNILQILLLNMAIILERLNMVHFMEPLVAL